MTGFVLRRRTLPEQLRYLSRKLAEGTDPVAIWLALEVIADELDGGHRPSFTCPRCGMTSWNEHDIAQGYCGNCHDWAGWTVRPG